MSQHDWHSGQLLCNILPCDTEPEVHCVLIDFAATSQTIAKELIHETDDYSGVLRTLVGPKVGLPIELVWEKFGKKEPWDQVTLGMPVEGGGFRLATATRPFAFVHEH